MMIRRSSVERRDMAIALRVTRNEYAIIRKFADQNRYSMAQLLEKAIWEYLEKNK